MRVVIVNCVYGVGSTGKIAADTQRALAESGHECLVCYGRGAAAGRDDVVKTSGELEAKLHSAAAKLFGFEYGYSFFATDRLIKTIRDFSPDVVQLHNLNANFVNAFKLLDFLKKSRLKTVLTLHAENLYTAGCEHSLGCEKWLEGCRSCEKMRSRLGGRFYDDTEIAFDRMKKAFSGFRDLTVVGVSDYLTKRAARSPVFHGYKFATIHNGIDLDSFSPCRDEALRRELSPDGRPIALYVTPNFRLPVKGGDRFLKLAGMTQELKFCVVGCDGGGIKAPQNVAFVPRLGDKRALARYYSSADCLVQTSLCESYPTVCVEAVSCGTPVVAFEAGGTGETIPEGAGQTVTPDDYDALKARLIHWCGVKLSTELIDRARSENSFKRMTDAYLKIYAEGQY